MGDPAPTEIRLMPVGYRFRPTDRELVGHYLYRKLTTDDPSIHDTVPEIGVCKYEPRDLLAWAASAASATKFDDFQCYFFSPRDYKYSNGKQFNRTTSRGFWKVTGRDRRIIDRDTNNVIGTKKTLVFYEGRVPEVKKTYWVIHEYHDAQLPPQQRTHVLCWLKKNDEKKRKEKIHVETDSILQPSSQYIEATDSMIQPSSQFIEATDSMIQPSSQFIEATDSMIQPSSQFIEATDSMIQPSSQFIENTDSMIQTSSQFIETADLMIQPLSHLIEATDSMIQAPSQFIEATDSMIQPLSHLIEVTDSIQPSSQLIEFTDSVIQPSSQLIEVTDSMIQPSSQLNKTKDSSIEETFGADEVVIQPTFQADEAMNSVVHAPPESNPAFEEVFDAGEFYLSPEEVDIVSLWQLPPAPSMDE